MRHQTSRQTGHYHIDHSRELLYANQPVAGQMQLSTPLRALLRHAYDYVRSSAMPALTICKYYIDTTPTLVYPPIRNIPLITCTATATLNKDLVYTPTVW